MSEYLVIPRGTSAPFDLVPVALAAATLKTVIQVAIPSTTDIRILGWGVSFDGASGSAVPVICSLVETTDSTPATVTAMTPEQWGNPIDTASLCVGGAAATGYNATAEGTSTAARMIDGQHVHPQAGYSVFWTDVRVQPRVAQSRFCRIRCKAPAIVNVIPWIMWAEPAI